WEAYSRQLGLPALKQDGEGYTQRDVEDLNKSVRELATEGKLEVTFDPAAAVPDELEFNIRGDQLEVEICQPKEVRRWILMLFIFPAIFICGGLGGGNIFAVILGIFIGVPMMGRYQGWSNSTCLVRINRKGIHYPEPHSWKKTKERHIRADAIKNVRVGKASPEQSFSSVVVKTDAGSHAIGEGLNKDALEWLKNCILSKIVDG
ncbi:MAG: hypothetical protein D3924_19090, partial [Candidatus Electrothrix sp. AR4]|nr:hypothetical protein [Candidatus Electrothrix sp. AR4]